MKLLFFGCPYCDSKHVTGVRGMWFRNTIASLLRHLEGHRYDPPRNQ